MGSALISFVQWRNDLALRPHLPALRARELSRTPQNLPVLEKVQVNSNTRRHMSTYKSNVSTYQPHYDSSSNSKEQSREKLSNKRNENVYEEDKCENDDSIAKDDLDSGEDHTESTTSSRGNAIIIDSAQHNRLFGNNNKMIAKRITACTHYTFPGQDAKREINKHVQRKNTSRYISKNSKENNCDNSKRELKPEKVPLKEKIHDAHKSEADSVKQSHLVRSRESETDEEIQSERESEQAAWDCVDGAYHLLSSSSTITTEMYRLLDSATYRASHVASLDNANWFARYQNGLNYINNTLCFKQSSCESWDYTLLTETNNSFVSLTRKLQEICALPELINKEAIGWRSVNRVIEKSNISGGNNNNKNKANHSCREKITTEWTRMRDNIVNHENSCTTNYMYTSFLFDTLETPYEGLKSINQNTYYMNPAQYWSYGELWNKIILFASGLHYLGVKPGSFVIVLDDNRWEWFVSCHACWALGAIVLTSPFMQRSVNRLAHDTIRVNDHSNSSSNGVLLVIGQEEHVHLVQKCYEEVRRERESEDMEVSNLTTRMKDALCHTFFASTQASSSSSSSTQTFTCHQTDMATENSNIDKNDVINSKHVTYAGEKKKKSNFAIPKAILTSPLLQQHTNRCYTSSLHTYPENNTHIINNNNNSNNNSNNNDDDVKRKTIKGALWWNDVMTLGERQLTQPWLTRHTSLHYKSTSRTKYEYTNKKAGKVQHHTHYNKSNNNSNNNKRQSEHEFNNEQEEQEILSEEQWMFIGEPYQLRASDLAMIVYSDGEAKGVTLTHGALAASATGYLLSFAKMQLNDKEHLEWTEECDESSFSKLEQPQEQQRWKRETQEKASRTTSHTQQEKQQDNKAQGHQNNDINNNNSNNNDNNNSNNKDNNNDIALQNCEKSNNAEHILSKLYKSVKNRLWFTMQGKEANNNSNANNVISSNNNIVTTHNSNENDEIFADDSITEWKHKNTKRSNKAIRLLKVIHRVCSSWLRPIHASSFLNYWSQRRSEINALSSRRHFNSRLQHSILPHESSLCSSRFTDHHNLTLSASPLPLLLPHKHTTREAYCNDEVASLLSSSLSSSTHYNINATSTLQTEWYPQAQEQYECDKTPPNHSSQGRRRRKWTWDDEPNTLIRPTLLTYQPVHHVMEFLMQNVFLFQGYLVCFGHDATLTDANVHPCGDLTCFKPQLFTTAPAFLTELKHSIQQSIEPGYRQLLFDVGYEARQGALRRQLETPFLNSFIFNQLRTLLGGKCKLILSTHAPLLHDVQEFIQVVCGVSVVQCYTSNVLAGSGLMQLYWGNDLNSLGQLCDGALEVKLRPCNGYNTEKSVKFGELLFHGPAMMSGYYKQEELTAYEMEDYYTDIIRNNEPYNINKLERVSNNNNNNNNKNNNNGVDVNNNKSTRRRKSKKENKKIMSLSEPEQYKIEEEEKKQTAKKLAQRSSCKYHHDHKIETNNNICQDYDSNNRILDKEMYNTKAYRNSKDNYENYDWTNSQYGVNEGWWHSSDIVERRSNGMFRLLDHLLQPPSYTILTHEAHYKTLPHCSNNKVNLELSNNYYHNINNNNNNNNNNCWFNNKYLLPPEQWEEQHYQKLIKREGNIPAYLTTQTITVNVVGLVGSRKLSNGHTICLPLIEHVYENHPLALTHGVCVLVHPHYATVCALVLTSEVQIQQFMNSIRASINEYNYNNSSNTTTWVHELISKIDERKLQWPLMLREATLHKAASLSFREFGLLHSDYNYHNSSSFSSSWSSSSSLSSPSSTNATDYLLALHEVVCHVRLLYDDWNIWNKCRTATGRINREAIAHRYEGVIHELFANIDNNKE